MAATKVCPNCGAKNPKANRFCEDCGYDMNKVSIPSATIDRLFCPNGHTVSDTSLGFCDICGEKLTSEKPVIKAPEPTPPSVPDAPTPQPPVIVENESHGKKCPACGAENPEDGVFCEECGKALTAAPVLPEPSPMSEPVPAPEIPSHPTPKELPEIPSIMRMLTNNDMKR